MSDLLRFWFVDMEMSKSNMQDNFKNGGDMEAEATALSFHLAGKELVADVYVGEVLELQSYSETRVSGLGGGGQISTDSSSNVSGSIAPITISSRVLNKTKVWVKTSEHDEDEWIFPVDVTELSVRKGHKIGRYGLFDSATGQGAVRKLINFTTKKVINIATESESLDLLGLLQEVKGSPGAIIVGIILGVAGGLFFGKISSPELGAAVFAAGLLGGIIKSYANKATLAETNRKYIKELEPFDKKVIELIASDKVPSYAAYVSNKECKNI